MQVLAMSNWEFVGNLLHLAATRAKYYAVLQEGCHRLQHEALRYIAWFGDNEVIGPTHDKEGINSNHI